MNEIPTICCEHGQSVPDAVRMHGYAPPLHRVGVVYDAIPLDGEVLVARIRVQRHSLPMPIFRRKEVTSNV